MKRLPILAACLAALLACPALAKEAPRLPVGPERLQVRGLPTPETVPRPVNPLPTSRLLLEEAEPIAAFDLDRGLTRLCRDGRFRQQREHLFIVKLGGYVHGAVIGGYWGLYDPARLAVPNLVYAVRWQDTGRCEVYVLRHLPA
ncbi:MAG: hypothetical protein ACFCUT_02485 [Kiloniellaceae bacterium]